MTAPEPLTLVELVRHLGEHDYWLGYDSSGMYIAMPVDKDSPAACGTGGTPWEAANEAMPGHPVVARDDAAELRAAVREYRHARDWYRYAWGTPDENGAHGRLAAADEALHRLAATEGNEP